MSEEQDSAVQADIYEQAYLKALFNEMSATYGLVNLISSLGFTVVWRTYCIQQLPEKIQGHCCDLLSGMGELIPLLKKQSNAIEQITALDFSSAMCANIKKHYRTIDEPLVVLEEDVFDSSIEEGSVDCLVCTFGLKTFTKKQQQQFAQLVKRLLKPGGQFAFLEISMPQNPLLRAPYLFYLRCVIPQIGRIFLGNPDNYRMLSVYTEAFENARYF